MSFSAVGQVFDPQGFKEHLEVLPDLSWADSVTVHHTAYPDLSMRPKGWTIQHMRNIADYYKNTMKWSAGPHLFTDEDQIFGMSPMTARGVHAAAFNAHSIGIEALGNYDKEDPFTGRGLMVWKTTATAVALVLQKLRLEPSDRTIHFHRDDPQTRKTCPGLKVVKPWFLKLVENEMHPPEEEEGEETKPSKEQVAKARALLAQALTLLQES